MTAGCANNTTEETIYQKINKKYIDIGDYSAKGTITVHSNKTENSYQFEQYHKAPDRFLLKYVEDGITVLLEEGATTVKNEKVNSEISLSASKDQYLCLFIDSFFKSYYTGETTTVKTAGGLVDKTMMLECNLDDDAHAACKQRLFIDTKTILPVRMEILDETEKVIAEIAFESFKFEKELEDSVFDIHQKKD